MVSLIFGKISVFTSNASKGEPTCEHAVFGNVDAMHDIWTTLVDVLVKLHVSLGPACKTVEKLHYVCLWLSELTIFLWVSVFHPQKLDQRWM